MAEFYLFKVNVIDRYSSFIEKGLTLPKRRRLTYRARQNRFSRFGCTVIKVSKKFKKKEKKGRALICWAYVAPSPKICPKPNFARLFRYLGNHDIINRAKYFCNRFTRVSLARGKTFSPGPLVQNEPPVAVLMIKRWDWSHFLCIDVQF